MIEFSENGHAIARAGCGLRRLLWCGAAVAALAAQPAQAQSKDNVVSGNPLEADVVVTANKTPSTVLETAQAISVVTSEEMELRGVQDLNAALSYSAGIRFRDYPGQQGMAEFFIRGFRANNTGAAVFRDGLRQQFNNLDGDVETYGLERVELLKGPASVLYGQGSPGGLVNMRSKRPTATPFYEVLAQAGSYERLQGAVDFGGPIDAGGKWRYRLTALYRDAESQIDYDRNNRIYVAPALSFVPDEATDITIMAQYFRTITGGSTQSFPGSGTIFANPNGEIPRNRFFGDPSLDRFMMENQSVAIEFSHAFNEWLSYHQIARYSESTLELDGIFDSNGGLLTNNRLFGRGAYNRDSSSKQFLTDASFAAKFDMGAVKHSMLVGLDYSVHRRRNLQFNGTIAPLDVYAPVYNVPITFSTTPVTNLLTTLDQVGIYGQEQAKIGGLTLTLGGRYDWVRGRNILRNANNRIIESPATAFTWRAGAIYETKFGLAPYFSYATSFLPSTGSNFAGQPFLPTRGEQFEAGLKYEPARGSLVTLSVYEITQTNVSTPDQAHPGFFVQQGEVRSRGAELEARIALMKALNLIVAYAYTDAKTTKANPNAAGLSDVGLRQVAVPKHDASAFVDYTIPISDSVGLTLGGGVRYVAGSFNPTNTLKTEGYTLIDATAAVDFGKLSVGLNATNLLDKHYFTPGIAASSVFYGNARQVLVTARYRF
jgi:iron complex outermembrane receptor protein